MIKVCVGVKNANLYKDPKQKNYSESIFSLSNILGFTNWIKLNWNRIMIPAIEETKGMICELYLSIFKQIKNLLLGSPTWIIENYFCVSYNQISPQQILG